MLPDIKLAIRLQILDDRASILAKEIAALPKHIAEVEKKLESHQRRLDADRAALAANQKERKKLEAEIQAQDPKIAKLKNQMLEAKNNEQYKAFQHEIDFCQQEIRRFEDRILELMTESEPLEKNVKAAEASLGVERRQVDAEKKQVQERTAVDQKEIDSLKAERAGILAQMTPKVAAEYERIRKGRAGVAIAEALNGRCSKCNITLRPQFLQELRRGDSIMVCESCKRMLYINPPESFDDLVPQGVRQTAE
ncbi:MAG: C4-type zinc ribbon domain-containing protein [Bryobacteraceae bacterium]|jgi:predicted  nucleic acid-binding Zn-ribbon protein